MDERPRDLDDVDWDEACEHLIGSFPEATLPEVVARAEAAAKILDGMGSVRTAEAMRRAAGHIRKRLLN